MLNQTIELITYRNEFYYRNYRRIIRLNMLLLLILCLLGGFVSYQKYTTKPMPRYFPTTPDGRLIDMPPFHENHLALGKQKIINSYVENMPEPAIPYNELLPLGEQAIVIYWASLAIEAIFDYDYVNYRKTIQEVRQYFTPQGHDRFVQALLDSKNLATVRARKAVVVPKIDGQIQLQGMGMVEGRVAWRLSVPLTLVFESAKQEDDLALLLVAELSIARVSTLTNPFYGLAIYQLNFMPRSE